VTESDKSAISVQISQKLLDLLQSLLILSYFKFHS
jgi:hypothetical protein